MNKEVMDVPMSSLEAHELIYGDPFNNPKKKVYNNQEFRSYKQIREAEKTILDLADRIRKNGRATRKNATDE